jgi:PTS system mannose-specific IIC component
MNGRDGGEVLRVRDVQVDDAGVVRHLVEGAVDAALVGAAVAGAFVGDTITGLIVGVILELIALATLPFGASRYPEWGSAAVVGGAIAAALRVQPAGSITVGVLAALATAWVGGWTLVKLRQWNAWLAGRQRSGLEAGARGTVIG